MKAEEVIIITGLSGSGKTIALNALRDGGFLGIDSLPTPLLPDLCNLLLGQVETLAEGIGERVFPEPKIRRVALQLDYWYVNAFSNVKDAVDFLRSGGVCVVVYFFECSDEVLIRRYQESRRPHPLKLAEPPAQTLGEALELERRMLSPFREIANRIFDTTVLTPHNLRRLIEEAIQGSRKLEISVISFGFKYGIPQDADLVFDARFLPNPHFVPDLKELTGQDAAVREYVFESGDAKTFIERIEEMVSFLIPKFTLEGKSYLTVAIGCTGGKHRSVALAEALASRLRLRELSPRVHHRHSANWGVF